MSSRENSPGIEAPILDPAPMRFRGQSPKLDLNFIGFDVVPLAIGAALLARAGEWTGWVGALLISVSVGDVAYRYIKTRIPKGSTLEIGVNAIIAGKRLVTADSIDHVVGSTQNGLIGPVHYMHLMSDDNRVILNVNLSQFFPKIESAQPLISHIELMARRDVSPEQLHDSYVEARKAYG